jgi:hypothetical protein
MLAARLAVWVLHHLSDLVLKEPSPTLEFEKLEEVRSAVEAKCVFLRTAKPVADVRLLRDVADAFKHHRPDRPSATVLVSTDVVPIGSGWGQMRWVKASTVVPSRSSSRRKTATSGPCRRSSRTSSMLG